MKLFFSTLASLLMLVVLSSPAMAMDSEKSGWMIPIGVFYSSASDNNASSTTTTSSSVLLEPAVGYKFSGGFYVGATYFYLSTSTSVSGASTETKTFYAPEVGYFGKGFGVRAGYAPGTASVTSPGFAPNTSYDQGSGFFVKVSYEFMLSSSVGLGPEIDYYNMTFTKQTAGGTQTTLGTNEQQSGIQPVFLVDIHF